MDDDSGGGEFEEAKRKGNAETEAATRIDDGVSLTKEKTSKSRKILELQGPR